MHPLREAMLDQMHLRGHSPRTQQSYLNAVSLLSRHYHRSPDRLSRDDLQNWILCLVKERQLSAATCRLYLNAMLRGKMVSALRKDWRAGKLHRIRQVEVDRVLDQLMQTDWVIHTQPYLRRADTVLRYLARYTHRTAISLSRIESVDPTSVRFRWKDYRDNRIKSMTLPGEEFLRRFLLHVLPKGLMRIRHYGYLANRVRVKQLEKIRQNLATRSGGDTAPPERISPGTERPAERCPNCKAGYLQFVGEILSERQRRRYALTVVS